MKTYHLYYVYTFARNDVSAPAIPAGFELSHLYAPSYTTGVPGGYGDDHFGDSLECRVERARDNTRRHVCTAHALDRA